jgi:hypothetical protein
MLRETPYAVLENASGSLESILRTVEDQASRAADYIAPTSALQVQTIDGSTNVILEAEHGMPTQSFKANDVAFNHLSKTADIEVRTARRLRDGYAPEFDALMNKIFQNEPKNKMLRTFDGEQPILRAVVSDKYKTFDNSDLIQAALPQLIGTEADWQVINGCVTDQKMAIRLKSRVQTGEPAVGDLMANGLCLSNSETGNGSVACSQMYWTLDCLNGMQTANKSRSTHVTGSRGSDHWHLLTDETKDLDNRALAARITDIVASFTSRESFDAVLEQMANAHNDVIENGILNPSAVIDAVVKVLAIPKKNTESLMAGLMSTVQQKGYAGKPVSRATIVNAVTAVANTVEADKVDDWQLAGSTILDLPRNQWETIAQAA